MRHTRCRKLWWTRERVLDGLRRFYRDFGFAPTATAEYQKRQQFTGNSNTGAGNPYPSSYGVLKYFGTFREAWTAAGIETDRAWEAWTPEEDWFLTEGAGVFSRRELAETLNRSPNAIDTVHHGPKQTRLARISISNHIREEKLSAGGKSGQRRR